MLIIILPETFQQPRSQIPRRSKLLCLQLLGNCSHQLQESHPASSFNHLLPIRTISSKLSLTHQEREQHPFFYIIHPPLPLPLLPYRNVRLESRKSWKTSANK